jgi:predicted ferric reductase
VLSVVVVLALWLSHRGLSALVDPTSFASSAGRMVGLIAADLLLIQVLLMARIPWLERWYGQDRLARRHRQVGFWSFWLMLGHVVLITIGYAQADRSGLVSEFWSLTTTYPGMLLATVGTALLVGVVVLSIRAARRSMRYESWHLLHLYAYLGVGLALPHQIWTGTDFNNSGVARAYWWTLWVAALGAILAFRVGTPLWRSMRHSLRVHHVVHEGPGVVSVYLRGRKLDELPVRAGQFFLWRFLDGPGWTRANPYTVSAAPRGTGLRITVKNLGDGSARLARLRKGTRVLVEGPYGALTAAKRRHRKVLLIAAGVGITAMRALLEDLVAAPGDITLLYRVRRMGEAVFRRELEETARRRGDRIIYLDGHRGADGSWLPAPTNARGEVGALRWLVPDVHEHDVFLCGPPEWMARVRQTLDDAGVPAEQVHSEEFAW